MCVKLAAACFFLLNHFRPLTVPAYQAWLGAALVGVIWLSNAFIQVPLHSRLGAGYDAAVIGQLVATNWIRTVAWTLRTFLVLFWTTRLIR